MDTTYQNYNNFTSTVLKDNSNNQDDFNIKVFFNDFYKLNIHQESVYKTVNIYKETLSYINNLKDEENIESILNLVSIDNCVKFEKNINSNSNCFELNFQINEEYEFSFGYLEILSSENKLEIKDGLTLEYLKTINCQLADDSVDNLLVYYGKYKFEDFKKKAVKILFPKAEKPEIFLYTIRLILIPFQKIKENIIPNNFLSLLFSNEKLKNIFNEEKLSKVVNKKIENLNEKNLIDKNGNNYFDLNQLSKVVELLDKKESNINIRKRKSYLYKKNQASKSNKLILKKLNDLEKKIDSLNNKISSLNLGKI